MARRRYILEIKNKYQARVKFRDYAINHATPTDNTIFAKKYAKNYAINHAINNATPTDNTIFMEVDAINYPGAFTCAYSEATALKCCLCSGSMHSLRQL